MQTTKVIYRSVWEEGMIDTTALLNMDSGEITDIEMSDEGADYEFHQHDLILSLDERVEAPVENSDEFDYAIESKNIHLFK